jgi:uncharacterized protein (DUF849 family)
MPVSMEELLADLQDCFRAGATGVHLHVRDDSGAGSTCPRLTHGMNDWTWPLVEDAFRRGHDTRVGFEDSVLLPDGRQAQSNAQLVQTALTLRASMQS